MKCNSTVFHLLSLLLFSPRVHAVSSSGFGSMAEQLLPQIGFGYSIVTFVLGFMSVALCAYTYNLWRISQKNPHMVPLHQVLLAFCVTAFCIAITIMDRPGTGTSIKPIPVVKTKKYEQGSTQSGYQDIHWSKKKSTQKNN